MGIISIEQTDSLFWLGRYSERVYTTLRLYSYRFDSMIDEAVDSYRSFCEMLDIQDIYGSKEVFRQKYPFDEENPDSIISNLMRAYDNAIVLREEIGSETLSYIQLAVYDMNRAKISRAPLIEMQKVMDNILAFWGIADDSIDSEQVRNMIKAGKRVERVDLYARLKAPAKELSREINRLVPRMERSGMKYKKENIESLKTLVAQQEIDYYKIVDKIETII
ncbi:MAG: alpha-E domain-containing protein [Bacteroidales bacterium]|nr:alpha-E domain-containing protein [Lachnoclostridium sp.]MCM1383889.1 alpha-E domain-containing protein [Lachnoclostridium sp.]MCM1464458.1 alpha-E domain-containing protein [Bacteroidales bacterium]